MTAKKDSARALSPSQIEAAVAPMLLQPLSSTVYVALAAYLDLLSRWNQKMNLTAVRDPQVLVGLHFGECLRAAQRIPQDVETVLDFGSGAGLPGILIQIARPELQVTLAESQKKKAAFLREAVRELDLAGATVHAGRAEDLPSTAAFDLVALRAVDKMESALSAAIPRIRRSREGLGGWCMLLTSKSEVSAVIDIDSRRSGKDAAVRWLEPELIPGTDQRVILLGSRL